MKVIYFSILSSVFNTPEMMLFTKTAQERCDVFAASMLTC